MPAPGATWTFAANTGRHNWLRLTPAYSVDLVERLIDESPNTDYILDPFAGSGTTAIAAAERGYHAEAWDINPFLVWLAQCKCTNSPFPDCHEATIFAQDIWQHATALAEEQLCPDPAMHQIERWWSDAHQWGVFQKPNG